MSRANPAAELPSGSPDDEVSALSTAIDAARARSRPASERFDRGRFQTALRKMDAVADDSDTDEAWDSIMDGIRAARGPAPEGA